MQTTEPLTVRAFARLLDVDEKAVRKAITRGRLSRSIRREGGRPVIADVDLARQEWVANAARTYVRPADPEPDPADVAAPADHDGPEFPRAPFNVYFETSNADGPAVVVLTIRDADEDDWFGVSLRPAQARQLAGVLRRLANKSEGL